MAMIMKTRYFSRDSFPGSLEPGGKFQPQPLDTTVDPSPENNRGAPHPGPMKLEVPKRCRPTGKLKRIYSKDCIKLLKAI